MGPGSSISGAGRTMAALRGLTMRGPWGHGPRRYGTRSAATGPDTDPAQLLRTCDPNLTQVRRDSDTSPAKSGASPAKAPSDGSAAQVRRNSDTRPAHDPHTSGGGGGGGRRLRSWSVKAKCEKLRENYGKIAGHCGATNQTSRSLKGHYLCTGGTQGTNTHARGTSKSNGGKIAENL